MWEHGIAWRPPITRFPERYCVRLRASGVCGLPQPDDPLCALNDDGNTYHLLDSRVSDLARFPPERRTRLGFFSAPVPCGERTVIAKLARSHTVIAVRLWYRETPPRNFRVQLWNAGEKTHETDIINNGQGRDPANWLPRRVSNISLPVTTETVAAIADRVQVVIDTCSTLSDEELAHYRAGTGDKDPTLGWLYELEVFARISRYEAWRRALLGR
jgi:hypothetical protein